MLFACMLAWSVQAQYAPPVDHAESFGALVNDEVISTHLHVLASDAFEGRETGTPGNTKAAEYIASQFEAMGIPPVPSLGGYFQEVTFSRISFEQVKLNIQGVEYTHLRDFLVPMSTLPGDQIAFSGKEYLFLGYGIDDPAYSDYKGKSVKDKAILIYKGEPVADNGNSRITGTPQTSAWSDGLEKKLRTAAEHGVAMVFIIEDQFRTLAAQERRAILGGNTIMGVPEITDHPYAPHVLISSNIAGALMGSRYDKIIKTRDAIRAGGKPKAIKVPVATSVLASRSVQSTPGVNVLAFIEGFDPERKHEVIVVTAHYDHLGKRGDDIFNGADDNASGTSGVMAIASAFAEAKRQGAGPRRSVLCLLVTGEEKGLLGSEYYAQYPVFPLKNTVANVNIDMIGRMDDKHEDPHYTYVIGANRLSSELHEINEAVNDRYLQLELDYTYDAPDDPNRFYYRSDHYNFAKHGIPVVFYFSGVHEDYHRPTDTADKIMFDKAANIARLAFHVTWELANRDNRIKVDRS